MDRPENWVCVGFYKPTGAELVNITNGKFRSWVKNDDIAEILNTEQIKGVSGKKRFRYTPIDYHTYIPEDALNEPYYVDFEVLRLFKSLLVEIGEFVFNSIYNIVENLAKGKKINPYSMSRYDYIQSLHSEIARHEDLISATELLGAIEEDDSAYGNAFRFMRENRKADKECVYDEILHICGLPEFFKGMVTEYLFCLS